MCLSLYRCRVFLKAENFAWPPGRETEWLGVRKGDFSLYTLVIFELCIGEHITYSKNKHT